MVIFLAGDIISLTLLVLFRGTIGVHNLTVGDQCRLLLGNTGNTKLTGYESETGTFDFEKLVVADGGEVTATGDLTGQSNKIQLGVSGV